MRNRSQYIAIILIFFSINSFAQFAFNYDDFEIDSTKESIHRITQTEKGTVTRIVEYDSLGRNVFSYSTLDCGEDWNKKYIFYLEANIYDNKNRVIIHYSLHSNAGHLRFYSQYDSLGNKTVFINETQNHTSDQINTNPYHRISEYKNYYELITSPEIIELDNKKSSAQLYSKEIFDNGKIVKEIYFNNDMSINWEKDFIYHDDRVSKELSYSYEEGKKSLSRIFTSECKSDTFFIKTLVNVNQNKTQDTIFHIYEIFNNQNKIIVERSFENGLFEERLYSYNEEGKLLFIDFDVHDKFGNEERDNPNESRKERKIYKYNKMGLIKCEIIREESHKKKEKKIFKYKIEYY